MSEVMITPQNSVENSTLSKDLEELSEAIGQLSEEDIKILLKFAKHLEKPIQHDNKNLLNVLPYLLELQNTKETQYGRSWCKHEDVSAFFNVERKWDRIFNIMSKALVSGTDVILNSEDESGTPTETFIDTVVDLGLYSLMWVGLIREIRPHQFENFLKNNQLDVKN
jgi:hypothetical protein